MRRLLIIVAVLGALLGSTSALAQDEFRAVAVPWVGTAPHVPHDGVAGEWHWLQAVAQGPCATTVQFRWDFQGDGEFDTAWTNAPSAWDLGIQHTYANDGQTRLYIAAVEARCGAAGEPVTAFFPVRMYAEPTQAQRVNRAISNGLWYGHRSLTRDVARTRANWSLEASTAALAQAMMNRGHRAGVDPTVDPYVEDVQWMLHYLLAHLTRFAAAGLQAGEQPDVNGDGFYLRFSGEENYAQGPMLEAISSWGDMTYEIPAAVGAIADVSERSLGEVVQNAAEYFYYSQSQISFDGEIIGGWDYSANAGNAIDTSQVGWTAVGLFAAEENGGLEVPQWVKDRLLRGARWMHSGRVGGVAGAYGYRTPSSRYGNVARSGAMLSGLAFALDKDPEADALVQQTIDYVAVTSFANGACTPGDGWCYGLTRNYYAMFQVAKGLRSFVPVPDRIGPDSWDWYETLATWLMDNQNGNGQFAGDAAWMTNASRQTMAHSLGLLVLIPTVFETPPVAVASAEPKLVGPGDLVTFTHRNSYAPDPLHPITTYRWNFFDEPADDTNGDGIVSPEEMVWEFETLDREATPTWSYDPDVGFGEEVTYTITLQVEDGLGRTSVDQESATVRVSLINHPPVVRPHPEGDFAYSVAIGDTVLLDASTSYDPDSDDEPFPNFPRDEITVLHWDLDADGVFETDGAVVEFELPEAWVVGDRRVIQVEACDDGRWVGSEDAECDGGDCSLCMQGSARITVTPERLLADVEDAVLDEGGTTTVQGPDNDPFFDPIGYSWTCDGLPVQPLEDGSSAEISAGGADGDFDGHDYTCRLTTRSGDFIAAGDFTVHLRNVAPVFTRAAADAGDEGAELVVNFEASDPADPVTYALDCGNDGTFEFEGLAGGPATCTFPDNGIFDVTIVAADDDGGQTSTTVQAEVRNVAPVFGLPECPVDLAYGEQGSIVLPVVDPGDDTFTCAPFAPLPEGATLEGCTLQWEPTVEQARNPPTMFSVQVTDDDGDSGSVSFPCSAVLRDEDGDGVPDLDDN